MIEGIASAFPEYVEKNYTPFIDEGGLYFINDNNDAYSLKPNIGIRLDGEKDFGATSKWKLKGNIGIGYEYELGNMNNQEKASLTSIEDAYHELAKTAEDKELVTEVK